MENTFVEIYKYKNTTKRQKLCKLAIKFFLIRELAQEVHHPENMGSRKIKQREKKQKKILNLEKYPRTVGHKSPVERMLWKPLTKNERTIHSTSLWNYETLRVREMILPAPLRREEKRVTHNVLGIKWLHISQQQC